MDTPLLRTAARLRVAHQILDQLQLIERWRTFGTPVLVGAVAYEVVVAPDIDLEVFCDEPRIEDGFEILRACALHPRVQGVRLHNHLQGPDQGLYWRVDYRHDDARVWKIDMWSLRRDHPGPYAAALVEPIRRVLTDETRTTIVDLKEQLIQRESPRYPSIALYQAVLDDGVRTIAELDSWMDQHGQQGLTFWKPGKAAS